MSYRIPAYWLASASTMAVIAVSFGGCAGGPNIKSGENAGPTASQPAPAMSSAADSPRTKPEHKAGDVNGRAQNVPLPIRAELTDENTKDGVEEYTKYWFSMLSYGFETGDAAAWSKQTSPSCVFCNALRRALPRAIKKVDGSSVVICRLLQCIQDSRLVLLRSRSSFTSFRKRSRITGLINLLVEVLPQEATPPLWSWLLMLTESGAFPICIRFVEERSNSKTC